MTPSVKIRAFICGYEKCRLKAYMPTPNDKPTIGWGSTGSDIRMGMVWTQAQCDERFMRDLKRFADGVSALITRTAKQSEFDALLSLAYNIGMAGFKKSSALANHNLGHRSTAALAFGLWNKQRNRTTGQLDVLNGLTRRRAAEAKIYLGGSY